MKILKKNRFLFGILSIYLLLHLVLFLSYTYDWFLPGLSSCKSGSFMCIPASTIIFFLTNLPSIQALGIFNVDIYSAGPEDLKMSVPVVMITSITIYGLIGFAIDFFRNKIAAQGQQKFK